MKMWIQWFGASFVSDSVYCTEVNYLLKFCGFIGCLFVSNKTTICNLQSTSISNILLDYYCMAWLARKAEEMDRCKVYTFGIFS